MNEKEEIGELINKYFYTQDMCKDAMSPHKYYDSYVDDFKREMLKLLLAAEQKETFNIIHNEKRYWIHIEEYIEPLPKSKEMKGLDEDIVKHINDNFEDLI